MGFASEVGIDLGTANVLVYIKGKGIVLNEPSVVAINNDTDEILAVGEEARQMLGRTPANIVAVRPLRDGVISDYDITERMLKYFIRKTCGTGRFFKPKIMVCVPSGVTEVEKRAVREAATQAGGKDVYLMEEPVAAAIGAGIDISKPDGIMVIDIGGGTTDIAVISLGGIVASTSVKIAGDKFDEAIIKYMRKNHKLYIGERSEIFGGPFMGIDEDEETGQEMDREIDLQTAVDEYEKGLIKHACEKYGSTRKAAKAIGISQTQLVRKKKKYGI